ncbi:hypothetical protein ABK040_009461 [Willaertia magna]
MNADQEQEIEALQSIYPTEFERISTNQYKIEIYPYTAETETEINNVGISLEIEYPNDYPESAIPILQLTTCRGFINNNQMNQLKIELNELANTYLGTSSVFAITSHIQEFLLNLNTEKLSTANNGNNNNNGGDSSLDRFTMDNEVLESNIGKGTPVTIENFREWKENFQKDKKKEMANKRIEKLAKLPGNKTGREIFEERQRVLISKIGEEAAQNYVEEEDEGLEEMDEDLFLEEDEE